MRVVLVASLFAAVTLASAQTDVREILKGDESRRRVTLNGEPKRYTGPVVAALRDEDAKVRRNAALALGEMDWAEEEAQRSARQNGTSVTEEDSQEGEACRAKVVEALAAAARDPDREVQQAAIRSMLTVLRNRHWGIHGEPFDDPSVVQPLIDLGPSGVSILRDTIRRRDNDGTRLSAIRVLARVRGQSSLDGLLEAIRKENGFLLWEAMDGAILYDDPRVIPAIVAHPGDMLWEFGGSPGHLILRKLGPRAAPAMLDGLAKNKDVWVRAVLIDSFSTIIDPRARPLLIKALKDRDGEVAWRAASTLAPYPHPSVVEALSKAAANLKASESVRRAARDSLESMTTSTNKP